MVTSKDPVRMRVAVVVGSGSATVRDVLRQGAAFAEVVLIFDSDEQDPQLGGLREMLCDEVDCVEFDPHDPAALLAWHRAAPLDALTTFAEDKIRLTAEIASLLGLPYHSPQCAVALTDKSVQREALDGAGLGIRFGVAHDVGEAEELIGTFAVPCVVKPLTGSGSRHTYAFDSVEDAATRLESLAMPFPVLVEARLRTGRHPRSDQLADVVSVETVFCDGAPVHLGVCDRFRLAEPFRETGMIFPSQLPDALLDSAYEVASRALSALGVTTGATHTELKLTPEGFEVVEVNGRLGGDVGRLFELSTGTHAAESVLRAVCGLEVAVPSPSAVAGVSMLVPPVEATALASKVPAAALRAVDGVVAIDVHSRPGDAVDYRTGWWAHVACVWYRVGDWSQLGRSQASVLEVAQVELMWAR